MWRDAARGYLSGWLRGLPPRVGIRILYYHGVVERKTDPLLERNLHLLCDFREHVRFLRRLRVLSLRELLDDLSAPRRDCRDAVIITFDDGYANNRLAAEVLAEHRIPWSLFVSTGAVGTASTIWPVELSLLLLHGSATTVHYLGQVWPLNSREERIATFQAIRNPVKHLPAECRQQCLDCIRAQFPAGETERLLSEFGSLQILNWEEIGELAGAGVEIGSHGVSHEIHHADQSRAICQSELSQSKEELQRRLCQPCRFFAFPNGDVNPASAGEVAASGYELSFTTRHGTVQRDVDPFLLPRLAAPGPTHRFVHKLHWSS